MGDPKQMAKMLKQMGINTKELEVRRVVFEMGDKKIIIDGPTVTEINMQGQKTYQIGGGETREESVVPEEDIKMVMDQTGKDRETVMKALEETNGDIAEAILKLQEE